jgi:saccharopine dehydrogenase-like NADP-dependent oxidoreductase
MKTILVLGAGRSSSALISYLLDYAGQTGNKVCVGDIQRDAALRRLRGHPAGEAIAFDIADARQSDTTISQSHIVVSLLPPHLHHTVAEFCLRHGLHLVTASYVSEAMRALDQAARSRSLIFLNECGLDPGIDHMSAMQVMDRIRKQGGKITSFKSFTGGLIAPGTDPGNPWRYKFTWNARNVVMAGQSTAKYLSDGKLGYIPYQQLFSRITPVSVPGHGEFEGYANRDSLKYIEDYQLRGVNTLLRGTLRYKGFCAAWNILVQLGCCEDTYEMEGVTLMSHNDFISSFLGEEPGTSEEKVMKRFRLAPNSGEIARLRWSGLFSDELVGLSKGTPASILEHILSKKWALQEHDKDLVVMWHQFNYELNGQAKEIQASLVVEGINAVDTAMARTVGLPMGIAVKVILEGRVKRRGVLIPVSAELYDPILAELGGMGIRLSETEA